MAIDLRTETLVALRDIGQFFGAAKQPSATTRWRWFRHGIRGIRLETIVVGGQRLTSREAVERFVERVTAAASGDKPPSRTRRQVRRDVDRARNFLRDEGFLADGQADAEGTADAC